MKSIAFSPFVRAFAPIAALPPALCLGLLLTPPALANDVQMAPSDCVAPYLSQAFPMRWHENYLMNPTSNTATWVICPVTYDVDVLPTSFVASVVGGRMSGASAELPSCFLTVNSAVNLAQPPFINGPADKAILRMDVQLLSSDPRIWLAAVGAPGGVPPLTAMTMFCKLPPGYGISQLQISNNF